MITKMALRIVAGSLAFSALNASAALDFPVSGTAASGLPGSLVTPGLLVTGFESTVDFSQVASWDFALNWGSAPMNLRLDASTVTIGSATYSLGAGSGPTPGLASFFPAGPLIPNSGAGFYSFSWVDTDSFQTVNLSGAFQVNAAFQIDAGAQPGVHQISFEVAGRPSSVGDGFAEFTYSTVSEPSVPMQVVITAVPEPEMVGLYVAGLTMLLTLARRRSRKTLQG